MEYPIKILGVIIFIWITHILVSVTFAVLIFRVQMMSIDFNTLLFFIGAIFGSILPDINYKGNKVRRKIPLWLLVEHRSITHSIFAILVAGLAIKIHLYLGYGLFIGVCSHILGDLFTPNGCCLLYPILKKKQSLGNIKVYSKTELKLIILLAVILITMIATISF